MEIKTAGKDSKARRGVSPCLQCLPVPRGGRRSLPRRCVLQSHHIAGTLAADRCEAASFVPDLSTSIGSADIPLRSRLVLVLVSLPCVILVVHSTMVVVMVVVI